VRIGITACQLPVWVCHCNKEAVESQHRMRLVIYPDENTFL